MCTEFRYTIHHNMDIERSKSSDKFHPLILEKSPQKRIIKIIETIKPEERQGLLEELTISIRAALSCTKCGNILEKDSVAFSCGHKYCKICSTNVCISCNAKHNIREQIRDFSEILHLLDEIRAHFNINAIIPEITKFHLKPTPVPSLPEEVYIFSDNSKIDTPLNRSTISTPKNTSARRNSKLLSTDKKPKSTKKAELSNKKLLLHKEQPGLGSTQLALETDSECLFMELVDKRKQKLTKPMHSYLELQSAIENLVEISPKSASRPKRKRETNDKDTPTDVKSEKVTERSAKKTRLASIFQMEKAESEKSFRTRSKKSNSNSLDLQNSGEVKEDKVTGCVSDVKVEHILAAAKNTIIDNEKDEKVEIKFSPIANADNEELDVNIWAKNEKNEKKKSLFRSVRERNKRDRSITKTIVNLFSGKVEEIRSEETTTLKAEGYQTMKNISVPQIPTKVSELSKDSMETKTNDLKKSEDVLESLLRTSRRTRKQTKLVEQSTEVVDIENAVAAHSTPRQLRIKEPEQSPVSEGVSKSDNAPMKKTSARKKSLELPEKIGNVSELSKNDNNTVTIVRKDEENKSNEKNQNVQSALFSAEDPATQPVLKHTYLKTYSGRKSLRKQKAETQEILENESSVVLQTGHVRNREAENSKQLENVLQKEAPATDVEAELSPPFSGDANIFSSTPYNVAAKKVVENVPFGEITPKVINMDTSPIKAAKRQSDLYKTKLQDGVNNLLLVSAEVHLQPNDAKTSEEIYPMVVDETSEEISLVNERNFKSNLNTSSSLTKTSQQLEEDRINEEKIKKIKELRNSIRNRNEKSLTNLKKNFQVSNAPGLGVQKVKRHSHNFNSSADMNTVEVEQAEQESENTTVDQKTLSTLEKTDMFIESNYGTADLLTLPSIPQWKDASCQTTPDLHLALLKKEFPHLFAKPNSSQSFPLNVYDTPDDITNAKTPTGTDIKFTTVSSVTTSEKKLLNEKDFTNHSVLCQSVGSLKSTCKTKASINVTTISGYTPFSSEKKESSSEEILSERRKVSCRLNFRNMVENSLDNLVIKDLLGKSITTNENEETLCEQSPAKSLERVDLGQSDVKMVLDTEIANTSHEIKFTDSLIEEEMLKCPAAEASGMLPKENSCVSTSLPENHLAPCSASVKVAESILDGEKTFYGGHSMNKSVSDDEVVPEGVTRNVIVKTDESDIDVDDDDFVVGTPTCAPKRRIGSSLEKPKSQPPKNISDVVLSLEDSDSKKLTPTMQSGIQPLNELSQNMLLRPEISSHRTPTSGLISQQSREVKKSSMELFNSMLSTSLTPVQICLTTSGLKETDLNSVKQFCTVFSASYADKLTNATSHLIVKADDRNQTNRTFKYLQAIVGCLRIVSVQWIQDCLKHQELLNEEKYIPLDSSGECGPLRAYNVLKGITPSPLSWLKDYCFFFTEPPPHGCTISQLQEMMEKTGAAVVKVTKDFKSYPGLHHVIIIMTDDEDCVDSYGMSIEGWLKAYQAVSIEFNWLLEVIGKNRMIPFGEFEVIEIPREILLQINFPADMLVVEENITHDD